MCGCCMDICSLLFSSPPHEIQFKIKYKICVINRMCACVKCAYVCVFIEFHYWTSFLSVNSFCQMMMMPNCCVQIVLCNMYTIHHSLALAPLSFSLSSPLFLPLFFHFAHFVYFSFFFLAFCLIFCKLSLNVMIMNKIKWNAHISAFYMNK